MVVARTGDVNSGGQERRDGTYPELEIVLNNGTKYKAIVEGPKYRGNSYKKKKHCPSRTSHRHSPALIKTSRKFISRLEAMMDGTLNRSLPTPREETNKKKPN